MSTIVPLDVEKDFVWISLMAINATVLLDYLAFHAQVCSVILLLSTFSFDPFSIGFFIEKEEERKKKR